ncbi:MAG: glycine cleavage system protein GcvH [Candidatus Eremiobacteraeota bacterium]|nr:glycine cleavage system protein GcvH [Candidatus Eremiobacteraeota bacterium]
MAQPEGLLYSREHEWVKVDGDRATVGITDYAQSSLGDIVYVELPRVGATLEASASAGVVESVKAVSDIYSPIGGEVLAVNDAIESDPSLVNREPFDAGWLFQLKLADVGQTSALLSPAQYQELVDAG